MAYFQGWAGWVKNSSPDSAWRYRFPLNNRRIGISCLAHPYWYANMGIGEQGAADATI